MSRVYAEVIGDPIAQSKSPVIHGYWLERLGIAADYRRCHVVPADLRNYVAKRRADPFWRGCNITMPHKQAIIPLCDSLDEAARQIGAVNTIVRAADGSLTGYNTDAAGFLEPLTAGLADSHVFRMARIVGTGGAARAIIVALANKGVTLVLAGRNVEKARDLLDELAPSGEHHAAPLDHFALPTDFAFDDRKGCFDLVVNASPLGMAGQPPLLFDLSHVPPGSIVYDIVTSPPETALLRSARNAGFRVIDGYAMLIGQAAAAFAKFFRQRAPRDDNDAGLREILMASA